MIFNCKTLSIAGMIGAPFLAIEMLTTDVTSSQGPQATTGWGAIMDTIYMIGWMCTILALLRSGAAGRQGWAKNVLKIQLILLTIANLYNIWSATGIGTDTALFRIADMIWPVSNAFMLVTGIAIIKAKVLTGWKRYAPLVAGLWLPSSIIPMLIAGRAPFTLYWGLAYSAIAWTAMAFAVYKAQEQSVVYNQYGYPRLAVTE